MSGFRPSLSHLSPEKKALLAKRLKEKKAAVESFSMRIPRRSDASHWPLSFSQQRLWFLDQLDPGNSAYNVYRAVRMHGALNVEALRRGLQEILRRHSVLRTIFPIIEGEPRQMIRPVPEVQLPETDLSDFPRARKELAVKRLANAEAHRPFRLDRDLLLRTALLRLGPEEFVLLLTTHHVVVDGWSVAIFFSELAALYDAFAAGKTSPLSEPPIDYADFAVWQRQWAEGSAIQDQIAYWKERLKAAPPVLELPTDRPRPEKACVRGARHYLLYPQELLDAVTALSRRAGTTHYMTLLAAFKVLLSFYAGQKEIVIGTPIAGRSQAELEGLIGCFSNTLVLRTDLSGNPGFAQLLQRVRDVALGAFAHPDVPFEKLVEVLKPKREPNRMALFQVNFRFQNAPPPPMQLSGLALEFLELDNKMAKFDLALELCIKPQGLGGYIEYFTDLFDADSIECMAEDYHRVLALVTKHPEKPLDAHDVRLTLLEKHQRVAVRPRTSTRVNPADLRRRPVAIAGEDQAAPIVSAPESPPSAMNDQENQQTPSFTLRPARLKDCDFIYRLRSETLRGYVSEFQGWSKEQQEAYYLDFDPAVHEIIVVEGKEAGAVAIIKNEKEYRYVNLHLLPEFQGRGIGTAIFKQSMAEADAKGVPIIFQGVLKNNPALRLYRRLGFEVIEEGELRYVMKRECPTPKAPSEPAPAQDNGKPAPTLRSIKRKAVGL